MQHAAPHSAATVAGEVPSTAGSQPSSSGRRTTRIAIALEQAHVGRLARVTEAEWAPGLLVFFCDILCWLLLYGSLASLRNDVSYSSGFELIVIDGLQLAVIVGCLFIIGGYSSS